MGHLQLSLSSAAANIDTSKEHQRGGTTAQTVFRTSSAADTLVAGESGKELTRMFDHRAFGIPNRNLGGVKTPPTHALRQYVSNLEAPKAGASSLYSCKIAVHSRATSTQRRHR